MAVVRPMPAVAPVMKTIFEFDMESSWYLE